MYTSLRKYCFTKLFKWHYLTQLRKAAGYKNKCKNSKDIFSWLFSSSSGTCGRPRLFQSAMPAGGAIAPQHRSRGRSPNPGRREGRDQELL